MRLRLLPEDTVPGPGCLELTIPRFLSSEVQSSEAVPEQRSEELPPELTQKDEALMRTVTRECVRDDVVRFSSLAAASWVQLNMSRVVNLGSNFVWMQPLARVRTYGVIFMVAMPQLDAC